MNTGEAGLPPELEALKLTIRQIVKDECYPLEPRVSRQSQSGGSGRRCASGNR